MIYGLIHRIESLSIDRRVTTIRKDFGYFGIREERDTLVGFIGIYFFCRREIGLIGMERGQIGMKIGEGIVEREENKKDLQNYKKK